MEVCIPCDTPVPQDKSNIGGSAADTCNLDHYKLRDLLVDDLGTCLNEFLNIEDNKLSTSSFDQFTEKNGIGNVAREDKQNDFDEKNSGNSASEMCLRKSSTFPHLGSPKSSLDGLLVGKGKQEDAVIAEVSEANGCNKYVNQCYAESLSLPNSSKIVSAMKGSREKQGIEPKKFSRKKLSVTWAPDVYDPVPAAASHVPSNKNQRHRNNGKKYGKNKLKGGGKSSRGSKGKDKKQFRKTSGGSKYKPIHGDDGLVGLSKPLMGIEILMSGVNTRSVEVVF